MFDQCRDRFLCFTFSFSLDLLLCFFYLPVSHFNKSSFHLLLSHSFTVPDRLVVLHWLTDSSRFSCASVFSQNWNSFVKQAPFLREKSHKSNWYPGLFSSFYCTATHRQRLPFSLQTSFFTSFSFVRISFFMIPVWSPLPCLLPLSLEESWGCCCCSWCWHNHQWFVGIFIFCASAPAVTALTVWKGEKKPEKFHQQWETVCVGF